MLLLANNLSVPLAYVPDKPNQENGPTSHNSMWILQTKALWVRNHEPHFADDSKAQRGQGTFQRLHSREEWKGRYDQTVPTFLQSWHLAKRDLEDWDLLAMACVSPRQGRVREWVWEEQWLSSPPAHWRSLGRCRPQGNSYRHLGLSGKLWRPGMGKTSYWGFCLAHWGVISLSLSLNYLTYCLAKRNLY